jgi:sialic acid synthase
MEMQLGVEDIFISEGVETAKVKLERSIASRRLIKAGELISENDLHMLSPGDGFKWAQKESVIGRKALADIPADEVIYASMLA